MTPADLRVLLNRHGVEGKEQDLIVEELIPHLIRPISALRLCESFMRFYGCSADWDRRYLSTSSEGKIYRSMQLALRANSIPVDHDSMIVTTYLGDRDGTSQAAE